MLKDLEQGNLTSTKDHHDHEHEEKPEKAKRPPPWYAGQGFEIKCFVYGMMIYTYSFAMIYLHDPFKRDRLIYRVSQILSTFFIFMALTSYYRCSANLSHTRIPWVPGCLLDTKFKICKKCNNGWKADRVHHCSQCDRCIGRMDHHCPWIDNCVGFANHKAFLCFCLYTSLGTFYYVILSANYVLDIFDAENIFERHGYFFYFSWLVLGTVVFGTGLWMFGLAMYNLKYAINNITGIETLTRFQMNYPCFSYITPFKKINPYDKGQLANILEFLGNDLFLWWFPTIMRSSYKASFYDKMPVVTALEKYEFIKGQPFVSSVPTSLKHFDYLGWIKQAEEFCTDKHLQFMNSVHEVGKRKDNTLGTLAFKDKFDFEIEESQDDPNQMTVKSFCAAPVSDPKAESKEIENTTLEPMPAPEKNKETPENFLDHQKKIAKELDDFFGDDGQGPQGFQNPIVK